MEGVSKQIFASRVGDTPYLALRRGLGEVEELPQTLCCRHPDVPSLQDVDLKRRALDRFDGQIYHEQSC